MANFLMVDTKVLRPETLAMLIADMRREADAVLSKEIAKCERAGVVYRPSKSFNAAAEREISACCRLLETLVGKAEADAMIAECTIASSKCGNCATR